MEFRIEVTLQPPPGDGWEVRVFDVGRDRYLRDTETGEALPPRAVRRAVVTRRLIDFVLPLPPADEAAAQPAGDAHHALCTNAASALDAFEQIVQRANADTKTFGRYLFDTLIGAGVWRVIAKAAAADRIEISLCWAADDPVFNRLPWEMMHTGKRFLAQEGGVAVLRRCPAALQQVARLSSPPRVLFVIGTDLQNDVIHPGAEYLRLLQGLRARGLEVSLQTRLLVRATLPQLEEAVADFQPDVIHVICHGAYDAQRKPYLQFADPEKRGRHVPVYPVPLADTLKAGGKGALPSIVVLSACHTADQDLRPVGQVCAPYAAALVAAGVPVAVGMAGPVTDQACRLFTRRFYESLLSSDGDIAHATAEGRRAAIRFGHTDPERSVDWTMPTIFLAGGVNGTRLDVTVRAADQLWQKVSRAFTPETFPAFCDRLEIVDRFDLLLANEAAQRVRLEGKDDLQTLCIASLCPDGPTKYGRSFLLKELAAKAMRDGHLPVLVEKSHVLHLSGWPRTPRALLETIALGVASTVALFNGDKKILHGSFCPNIWLLLETAPGTRLPDDAAARLDGERDPDNPRAQAAALRLDLLAFLEAVRALRPDPEKTRLVLLIDDVHRTSEEVVAALRAFLGPFGLRQAREDIRTVLMFSNEGTDEQQVMIHALLDFANMSWALRVELDRFKAPREERDAYQYFLLTYQENGTPVPLTVAPGGEIILTLFSTDVQGIPSRLKSAGAAKVQAWLQLVRNNLLPQLQEARDEDFLSNAIALEREELL